VTPEAFSGLLVASQGLRWRHEIARVSGFSRPRLLSSYKEGVVVVGEAAKLDIAYADASTAEAAIDLCRALGRDVPWIKRW
jgi:hypothetical protein